MLRSALIVEVLLLMNWGAIAQLNKVYTVTASRDFDTVDFYLKATSADGILKRTKLSKNPLTIYGNLNLDKITPTFARTVKNGICYTQLILDEYNSSGFGNNFFMAFSRSGKENNFWEVHLNDDMIYKLCLVYGVGNVDVNLTGTAVSQLKIKSGSADIMVGYDDGHTNHLQMDTFYVQADFGSIIAERMALTRAKNVIVKIGFGNVLLDFHQNITERCNIDASVGAGNLEILLPKENTPVIIHVRDSPLCAVRTPEGFEEVEKNVFVNKHYSSSAENLLTFDIDVALGLIRFHYPD